jgi:hypothetical protein
LTILTESLIVYDIITTKGITMNKDIQKTYDQLLKEYGADTDNGWIDYFHFLSHFTKKDEGSVLHQLMFEIASGDFKIVNADYNEDKDVYEVNPQGEYPLILFTEEIFDNSTIEPPRPV